MTDALSGFGVDLESLASQLGKQALPVKAGRVAHIDADFMAYIIACDTVAEMEGEKPMRDLAHKYGQVREFASYLTRMAGAEKYVLHITPAGSTKGGRREQAVQAEYQGNRKDREPPEHLETIRQFMVEECSGVAHFDQEADDGLAQAARQENTVIISDDKDLHMVPGLHYNTKAGELVEVGPDEFGTLWIDESGSQKKVRGRGPIWFWAQCIMGDTADNIKGLPVIAGADHLRVQSTKAFDTLRARINEGKGDPEKNMAKLDEMLWSNKKCGQMMAYNLIKDVQSSRDAIQLVLRLFDNARRSGHTFRHWKTGEEVTPRMALAGDMRTLWMRRTKNPDDVFVWLKGNVT